MQEEAAPKRTLFDIIENMSQVNAALESIEGQPDSEDTKKVIDEALAELFKEQGVKVDNYCALMRSYEAKAAICKAEADQYKEEVKRLTDLSKSWTSKCKRLKDFIKIAMNLGKIDLLQGDTSKIRRQATAKAISISPNATVDNVSAEFVKTEKVIDAQAVKVYLEAGGTLDWASLEGGETIRIY